MSAIRDAVDTLRATLASSPTFRAWVGITSGTEEEKQAAALLRVHRYEAGPAAALPLAIVAPGRGALNINRNGVRALGYQGELLLQLEAAIGLDADGVVDAADAASFDGIVSTILAELVSATDVGGGLYVDTATVVARDWTDVERRQEVGGDVIQWCAASLRWGVPG